MILLSVDANLGERLSQNLLYSRYFGFTMRLTRYAGLVVMKGEAKWNAFLSKYSCRYIM